MILQYKNMHPINVILVIEYNNNNIIVSHLENIGILIEAGMEGLASLLNANLRHEMLSCIKSINRASIPTAYCLHGSSLLVLSSRYSETRFSR